MRVIRKEFDENMGEERKRVCLNCKHREMRGASDFCTYIQPPQYMHYADVFEHWCPHWSASGGKAIRITVDEAISMVKKVHEEKGDYDIKIGFTEQNSSGVFAVEIFYKWKLNCWEKSVHQIDHVVRGTDGIWRVQSGLYRLDFSEKKTKNK